MIVVHHLNNSAVAARVRALERGPYDFASP
jgi:hypothetical protein